MGKISDTLKKRTKEKADAISSVGPGSDPKESRKDADNVVALGNACKICHDLDPNLVTYHAPQSVEAELFKVLRTNLLYPATGKPCKKMLVTSALPSDGKSFVSSNLAISISQGVEEYVLLIDGDVRRPTIHSNFGFGQVVGLSEHLATGADIGKMLIKSPIPKLTILPAGQTPRNPTELLSSKKMQTLLEEVATRYEDRFILIDSPPPSMAAETTAIINFVDGVILVVRAGKTPKKAVAEAIEQIGKEKIVGVVLNYSDQALKRYYGYGKPYYADKEK